MILNLNFLISKIESEDIRFFYNDQMIFKNLVIAKYSSKDNKISESLLNIFFMVSRIVVKNVNNLYNLLKNSEFLLDKDDIVNEFFIIMQNCVKNFDFSKKVEFFWYYNSSLLRHTLKLLNTYKNKMIVTNEDFLFQHNDMIIDTFVFELKNMGFNDKQMEIISSKINGDKVKDCIEKLNISYNSYYEQYNLIMKKIKVCYE